MKRVLHDVLLRPLLTEKITAMRESGNKVGFVVRSEANRIQIKRAVESVLKVRVERVNVLNVMGKTKRLGRFAGKKPDWKKAIVTLKEGEKLEMYEGV
ncbi:MAG TPA: 50S ribosomal protein L23 [Nitrospiraceae bacterium]|nr:50S ribosomal protein L23 [Nitrospiraceae bacterium]